MNLRTNLVNAVDRLGTALGFLGALCLFAALGWYLVQGQLDRPVVVLLAVGLGLIVYAALERPENTAQTLSSRGVRYGSNTLLMSVAFVGIVILINILGNRFSTRLDLTQNQIYSLSPLSIQVLQELQQPVHVYSFYSAQAGGKGPIEDLFKEYARHSSQFTYEFVDIQVAPGIARKYNVQFPGTSVLTSGDKQQTITGSDEGAITSGLLKLSRTKAEVAYYLTGHGEVDFTASTPDGASGVKTALEAQNYTVKPLNLGTASKVPADTSLLIIAGPTAPFLPEELTTLESYLDGGGKALILVDQRQQKLLEPLAERYGVQIGNGVVIDPVSSYQGDVLSPLIGQYQSSPITKDLPELLFQAATSVTPMQTPPAGLQTQPLAQTSQESWLETDTKTAHFDPGVDPRGPLTVAVSVTKAGAAANDASAMRLVFVGDVAFAVNGVTQVGPGNSILVSNVANWLTSNEDLIQIQAKVPTDRTLVLSGTKQNILMLGSIAVPVLLVLGIGSFVLWRRR
jgi:ABC-type uncharacterized transport system involved in gliding motility auxiliary subunit